MMTPPDRRMPQRAQKALGLDGGEAPPPAEVFALVAAGRETAGALAWGFFAIRRLFGSLTDC